MAALTRLNMLRQITLSNISRVAFANSRSISESKNELNTERVTHTGQVCIVINGIYYYY